MNECVCIYIYIMSLVGINFDLVCFSDLIINHTQKIKETFHVKCEKVITIYSKQKDT